MRFALRDDDTNFFTDPDALRREYADVWDQVPVSLAVVPFYAGGVPGTREQDGRAYPLGDNADLVAFLCEGVAAGRLSTMLHGYHHADVPGGYEFQAGLDLDAKLRHGRRYLAGLLGRTPRVFVPPHNALDHAGFRALNAERMDVLGSFAFYHPKHRPWDARTPLNYLRLQWYRVKTGRRRHEHFVLPRPLRFSHHAEMGCVGLYRDTTREFLIASFEEARAAGGDFCLATHYWEFDDHMRVVLRYLLDHASRYSDVRFVPADALFQPDR